MKLNLQQNLKNRGLGLSKDRKVGRSEDRAVIRQTSHSELSGQIRIQLKCVEGSGIHLVDKKLSKFSRTVKFKSDLSNS